MTNDDAITRELAAIRVAVQSMAEILGEIRTIMARDEEAGKVLIEHQEAHMREVTRHMERGKEIAEQNQALYQQRSLSSGHA